MRKHEIPIQCFTVLSGSMDNLKGGGSYEDLEIFYHQSRRVHRI